MVRKPLRCLLGFHSFVQRHPADERPDGPDHQICRRCGTRRDVPFAGVPPGFLGGGSGRGMA